MKTIRFAAQSGLALTASLYTEASETLVDSSSATEIGIPTIYDSEFNNLASGNYVLVVLTDQMVVAASWEVAVGEGNQIYDAVEVGTLDMGIVPSEPEPPISPPESDTLANSYIEYYGGISLSDIARTITLSHTDQNGNPISEVRVTVTENSTQEDYGPILSNQDGQTEFCLPSGEYSVNQIKPEYDFNNPSTLIVQ